jgi:peptide/nickel transport system permease protein
MARYLATRIGLGILTILGVVLLTFLLMFVVPGDPARTIAGPRATPQVLAIVQSNLHLNQPVLVQLGDYLSAMVQGDLGVSYVQDQPVASIIGARLPATIELGLAGLALELILGGALGVWDGLRAKRSRMLAVVNVGFLSVPAFSLGFVMLLLFGYKLSLFPIDGGTGGDRIVLPALTLGLFGMPYYANVVRDAMQETLAASYTRTAVAKGLPRGHVLRHHVLRNALSPALTMAGLDFAILLSGVVFVETVFGWPGIGQLQTQAFYNVDRPVLMGTVVIAAVLVVIATLAIDLIRMAIDPRTRLVAQ